MILVFLIADAGGVPPAPPKGEPPDRTSAGIHAVGSPPEDTGPPWSVILCLVVFSLEWIAPATRRGAEGCRRGGARGGGRAPASAARESGPGIRASSTEALEHSRAPLRPSLARSGKQRG